MRLFHNNPTQIFSGLGFKPLLRNEAPYFENLNRPARSAYDYTSKLALLTSYFGGVSILQPGVESTIHEFSLYEIVRITDEELVLPARPGDPAHDRYAIVLAEPEVDPITQIRQNIIVCTFNPNFVYPDKAASIAWGVFNGDPLYLDPSNTETFLSGTPTSDSEYHIGFHPIAFQTGRSSIFFAGAKRLGTNPAPPVPA